MVQLYKRKGGEILVNTATANNQSGGNIALLPGGGFVVVWSDGSMTGADTSSFAVRGQRFDAAGNPVGGEFLVNSTVTGNQSGPTVATLASGRFVVTWSDASATGGDTSGIAVRGQIFEADGTPVGAEFLINTATANNQSLPAIVELSGGGFVVTWADNSGVGGDTSGSAVKAQIFNAAGAPVGGEFLANTTTLGSQGSAGLNVIGLAGGGFAIAYSTTSVIGSEAHATIWVQQFDAAGTKVGGESVVNGDTLGNIINVNVTALNAGFIVTWAQQDSLQFPGIPVTYNVRAQMFDAAGAKLGAEFLVNTNIVDSQTGADVDRLPGGGFLITWQSPAEGTTDLNIYGQFFDDNGARIGGEFLVNTVTGGSQTQARIEVLPSGDIVITWTDSSATGTDASGSGIKMQILTLSTDAPTDIALSDMSIGETAVENLAVATLSATNAAAINSHFTYTIVSDASGGAFRIEGDKLVVDDSSKLDFETQPTVEVRIRATDLNGASYEETLTIAVGDVVTETRYAAGDALAVTNDVTGFNGSVAAVALAGGGYALIINHVEFGAGDTFRIQIRDAAGLLVGTPVDFEPAGPGAGMVAEALAGGGFVVAYRGDSIVVGNGNGFPIRLQMFDASGHAVGPEILASTTNDSILGDPDIALLSNGNFVVSWTLPLHEDGSDGGPFPSQIMARIFDGTGAPVGGEFRVNTGIEGGQVFSHVAALADGGFVATWREGTAVEAQIFNAAGAKVGGEHVVVAAGAENSNLVALDNGTFLVTWDDIVFEDDDFVLVGIFGQLVGADGVNIGAPITILPFGNAYFHHLEAMPGGFVVTWSEQTPDPSDDEDWLDSWAQMYDLAGLPIGEAFQLSPEGGNGRVSNVAAAADGNLLFAWDYEHFDANLSTSSNMLARIFTREALPPSGPTEGPDILNGTPGNDVIDGLGGNDIINGLAGNDVLIGGAGADILTGGADNDIYRVETADDLVIEAVGGGTDAIYAVNSYALGAGSEVETLSAIDPALAVAMNLTGNEFANLIIGTAGGNTLIGGGGADILIGGAGNDAYRVEEAGDVVVENLGGGFDAIYAVGSYTLAAGSEIELLSAIAPAVAAAMNLTGNEFANLIIGNAAGNTLIGGGGADTLIGGAGNDFYRVEEAGDIVIEGIGGGFDSVYAVVSYTLAAGSEIELLSAIDPASTAGMNLTGNEYANLIYGNAAANTLIGGGGADVLIGGAGGDFYRVEEMADVVVEAAGGGSDAVYAVGSYVLAAGSEVELLSAIDPGSTAAMDLTGNEYANAIYGNAGSNTLIGGGGADTLFGGAGNDYYRVEEAGDAVVEAVGGGTDAVYAVASYTLAAGTEIEVLSAIDPASMAAMNLTGNEFGNVIYGTAGANTLSGGLGHDALWGFGGADNFLFNAAGPNNWDTIVDFATGTDKILLDHNVFVGIGPLGALGPGVFSDSGANTPEARILYAVGLGWLSYDADGSGPGAAVLFASLMPGDAITGLDFIVV